MKDAYINLRAAMSALVRGMSDKYPRAPAFHNMILKIDHGSVEISASRQWSGIQNVFAEFPKELKAIQEAALAFGDTCPTIAHPITVTAAQYDLLEKGASPKDLSVSVSGVGLLTKDPDQMGKSMERFFLIEEQLDAQGMMAGERERYLVTSTDRLENATNYVLYARSSTEAALKYASHWMSLEGFKDFFQREAGGADYMQSLLKNIVIAKIEPVSAFDLAYGIQDPIEDPVEFAFPG